MGNKDSSKKVNLSLVLHCQGGIMAAGVRTVHWRRPWCRIVQIVCGYASPIGEERKCTNDERIASCVKLRCSEEHFASYNQCRTIVKSSDVTFCN